MGGKGPAPKPANLRQRRNKTTTAAALPAEAPVKRAPELPRDRQWHKMTVSFWRDVWSSPMRDEYLKADIHGLYVLADLVDQYWCKPSVKLAAEIRQQRQCYGLTPIDRRRLQWEVAKVDAVQPKPPKREKSTGDPRDLMRVVG